MKGRLHGVPAVVTQAPASCFWPPAANRRGASQLRTVSQAGMASIADWQAVCLPSGSDEISESLDVKGGGVMVYVGPRVHMV